MNKVYNEYSSDIIRSDFRTVMPVSDLNFNTPNNYTVFKLDHGDSFYDGRIMYHITGKLVKKIDGSDYAGGSTIKLADNFAAFLFNRIEVRKHNTLIDVVEHPGITSTIKGLVSYSQSQRHTLYSSGFVSSFTGGGKFEAYGTMGHLGLGFFDSLRYPMFKGGFEITFIRAEDDDAIYHWKGAEAGATEPADGKVVIESFTLRVPLVEYAPTSKIQLIDSLKSLSDGDKLVYKYFQWQCIEHKGVTGSTFSFDITNLYRNIFNPQFIIIGLQTDRGNNQKKNPSGFDHCNVKNAVVRINREMYPQELQNMDITNSKHMILYDMYQNFRRSKFGDDDVHLSLDQFIKLYPLIVIDTSLHPVLNDRSKNDIQIDLDFSSAITGTNTVAYVVVVSPTKFSYDITRNLIK